MTAPPSWRFSASQGRLATLALVHPREVFRPRAKPPYRAIALLTRIAIRLSYPRWLSVVEPLNVERQERGSRCNGARPPTYALIAAPVRVPLLPMKPISLLDETCGLAPCPGNISDAPGFLAPVMEVLACAPVVRACLARYVMATRTFIPASRSLQAVSMLLQQTTMSTL